MINKEAFLIDSLVKELNGLGIKDAVNDGDLNPLIGYALVNHDPNNNVRVQITPRKKQPAFNEYNNQNPTIYLDDNRGELGMCLKHAMQFIISCTDATNTLHLMNSFGQTIVDLTNNGSNVVEIFVNGIKYTLNDYIAYSGTNRIFNYNIFQPYGILNSEILGDYRLYLQGLNSARLEVRVTPIGQTNSLTIDQVKQVFTESTMLPNPTLSYYSNEDFYGFYVCMESSSIPSITYIDYAKIETMDALLSAGYITEYNNEADSLNINVIEDGVETTLTATFTKRLVSSYGEDLPLRKHDYLLVLEARGIDPNSINIRNISAKYNKYKMINNERTLLESGTVIDNNYIYLINNQFVHPMTLTEEDNGVFFEFEIDFDGEGNLFTGAGHKLNIVTTVEPDDYIPIQNISRDRVTGDSVMPITEIDLSELDYILYDRWQWYEFTIGINPKSILFVEPIEVTSENILIDVPMVDNPELNLRKDTIPNNGMNLSYLNQADSKSTILVRIRVPAGQPCKVRVYEQDYTLYEINCNRDTNGTVTSSDESYPWYNPKTDSVLLSRGDMIIYMNELGLNKAITIKGNGSTMFSQYADDTFDMSLGDITWKRPVGSNDEALYLSYNYNSVIVESNARQTKTEYELPELVTTEIDYVTIYSLVDEGINIHFYKLGEGNFVQTYLGKVFIAWAYDVNKPVSFITYGSKSVGSPYDVIDAEDFGPVTFEPLVGFSTAISLTNIEEI